MRISEFTCEYAINPTGIGSRQPRFNWKLEADERRGVIQTGYRLVVWQRNLSARTLVWDSGDVQSGQSAHIVYNGAPLLSRSLYEVELRVHDNCGHSTRHESSFETGIFDPDEWSAEWIGWDHQAAGQPEAVSPLLRQTFTVREGLARARVYATALGLYKLELDGAELGDAEFAPGWTSYAKRLQTQTYLIVPGELPPGPHTIGAMLGDGWYKGHLTWENRRNVWGSERALLLELHLWYADGTGERIISGTDWLAADGPIRSSDLYNGEHYDARLEISGWSQPGATPDARRWQPAKPVSHGKSMLLPQQSVPVRRIQQLPPVTLIRTPKGEAVLDFGQNMTGRVSFAISAPAGTRLELAHAEVLDKNGHFYTDNLRGARQTNVYICKGDGIEKYEPRFTFQGFRYVKLSGFPEPIDPQAFTAHVIHSDMRPTGSFSCSDPLLNQLQHNIVWGQKGNFLDVPTDCPQRDERMGWTGDAQAFIRTAAFNMDSAFFFTKWLHDLKADQLPSGGVPQVIPCIDTGGFNSAAWGDAVVICPWTLYVRYGDTRILQEMYGSMKAWVEFIRRQGPEPYLWLDGVHVGDWLALDGGEGNIRGATPHDLIATAYYACSADLLAKAAAVLGCEEDAACYSDLRSQVALHYRRAFLTSEGRLSCQTQTAHVLTLAFNLAEEDQRQSIADDLATMIADNGCKLTTGFVGTPYLCHVLSDHGHADIAYRLLMQQEYPSWLYSVRRGATTIWEHWDGIREDGSFWSPEMNSFNHYAYGAIGDWMYRYIAGIDTDLTRPGYRRSLIAPHPGGGLQHASATYESVYGPIVSGWTLDQSGNIRIDIAVPPNTSAIVELPGAELASVTEGESRLSDAPCVTDAHQAGSSVRLEIGSGRYRFEYPYRP